ncbi:MAG: biopolymer transporter ExbD [Planctomycetota bacterium]
MSMNAAPIRRRRRHHRLMGEINVTPMVDVMLVLLVIFMITAPAMKDVVDVDLPQTKSATSSDPKTVLFSVAIDSVGRVHAGGRMLNPAEVAAELPKLLQGHEKEPLTLMVHRQLPFDVAVKVIAIIRSCGIRAINIAVEGTGK